MPNMDKKQKKSLKRLECNIRGRVDLLRVSAGGLEAIRRLRHSRDCRPAGFGDGARSEAQDGTRENDQTKIAERPVPSPKRLRAGRSDRGQKGELTRS